jgi:ribosomal protein S18 acetylase RimI-like enzyme
MLIRPMTIEDCEQVAQIEAASFSVPWSLRAFTETVEKENFRYFVAEEAGEILGYCGFLFVLDEAEIPNVCVKESARCRGVGKQMMTRFIADTFGICAVLTAAARLFFPWRRMPGAADPGSGRSWR